MKDLETSLSNLKVYMKDVRAFYGDTAEDKADKEDKDSNDKSKADDVGQEFIRTLTDFAAHYKRCCTDIEDWAEQEVTTIQNKLLFSFRFLSSHHLSQRKDAARKEKEKERAEKKLATPAARNVGRRTKPTAESASGNDFAKYEAEQQLSPDDLVRRFKQEMEDRRKSISGNEDEKEEDNEYDEDWK
jgi:hypothetical protein